MRDVDDDRSIRRLPSPPFIRRIPMVDKGEDGGVEVWEERTAGIHKESYVACLPTSRADFIERMRPRKRHHVVWVVATETLPERAFVERRHLEGVLLLGVATDDDASTLLQQL